MADLGALFAAGREAWLRNDLAAAEQALRSALVVSPGNATVRAALSGVLLKTGRLAEGFDHFEAWRALPERAGKGAPQLPFRRWRGEPVADRRVLIWSEDGFGDQILFARFAKLLRDRGANVTWFGPPEISRLFAGSLGIAMRRSDEPAEFTGVDFFCPSSALAAGFGLTLETLPNAPYLAAAPTPVGALIGVMTAGNPGNIAGRPRALSADQAQRLLALPGAMDLAPDATGAKDFQDTAALVAGLDLVVSVDTSVANLAGAMGRPVWVLAPYVGDWRWMAGGETTPWYPSARIFRQGADHDWTPVVDRVVREITARAGQGAS